MITKYIKMCKTDVRKLERDLKDYGRQVTSNKKNSEDFLRRIGVTTKNGNFSRDFQKICIPKGLD